MPFADIAGGLGLLFAPGALLWLVAGLCVGFVVGILPGLSSSNTAALLLPLAITLPTESTLILIVSIYAGAQFGGAVPAILLNIPGEAGSAVTALDGYPMTQQGRAGEAIGIARMASTFGGVVSGIVILFLLAPIGALALKFGAREMFVIILIGLVVASALMGDSVRKGLLAGLLGLVLATVGASPLTGQARFTFGSLELFDGVSFIAALIGLFAISELLLTVRDRYNPTLPPMSRTAGIRSELADAMKGVRQTFRHWQTALHATAVGLVLGILPGGGTAVSNFLSYSLAKRRSKTPELFGKGHPAGVVASEASDNAVTSAAMAPTLTLGIPGSATAAIILAALYIQGIQPGPQIMQTHAAEAYAAVLALILASLLIMPLGILLATPLTWVIRVPAAYLAPVILLICLAGTYAERGAVFDIGVALVFGALGYLLRAHGYPIIPVVLGLVLGPLAERHLLRGLALGNDDFGYFFSSPTVIVLWCLLGAVAIYLFRTPLRAKRAKTESTTAGTT